jgi:hypothetical protein
MRLQIIIILLVIFSLFIFGCESKSTDIVNNISENKSDNVSANLVDNTTKPNVSINMTINARIIS